ncbi:MAG: hypothetical protein HY722_03245 [Planctomycetes bacterium]|nr:hypothetical protein [Planctomycetota bacterium]
MNAFARRKVVVLATLAAVALSLALAHGARGGDPEPDPPGEDREMHPEELDDLMEATGKYVKSTTALLKERRHAEAVTQFERAARLAAQVARFEPPIHKERIETWRAWAREYPKEAERFLATLRKAAAGEVRTGEVTAAQGRLLKHCKRCHDEFQPEEDEEDDEDD